MAPATGMEVTEMTQSTPERREGKQPAEGAERTRPGRTCRPPADIGESRDAVWLSVDMPGVDERSVEVGLDEGVLTIEGRVALEEYAGLQPLYTEYNVGDFERRFRISDRIDPDRIEARLQDGVLFLNLPKAEEARPRTIPIQAS